MVLVGEHCSAVAEQAACLQRKQVSWPVRTVSFLRRPTHAQPPELDEDTWMDAMLARHMSRSTKTFQDDALAVHHLSTGVDCDSNILYCMCWNAHDNMGRFRCNMQCGRCGIQLATAILGGWGALQRAKHDVGQNLLVCITRSRTACGTARKTITSQVSTEPHSQRKNSS